MRLLKMRQNHHALVLDVFVKDVEMSQRLVEMPQQIVEMSQPLVQ